MRHFFSNLVLFFVGLIYILAISCGKNGGSDVTPNVLAKSMLVNAADTSSLDFYVNGSKQNTTAIAYTSNSNYFDVKLTTGQKTTISVKSTTTALSFADSVLMNDKVGYSFFVYRDSNLTKKPLYKISTDDLSVPGSGKAKIRIAHLVNDIITSGLDIQTVSPGGAATATNDLSNLHFKDISNFTEVDKGTKDIKIKISGTTNLVTTISNVNLADGKIYTIVLQGKASALKINIITNL